MKCLVLEMMMVLYVCTYICSFAKHNREKEKKRDKTLDYPGSSTYYIMYKVINEWIYSMEGFEAGNIHLLHSRTFDGWV